MTSKGFQEILDVDSLDRFLQQANETPAILFKHSNTCGISARAHRQMAEVEQAIGIIIVQNARPVSEEIVRRFGLSHETPQVLIVRGGDLLWNASHHNVSAPAVEAALEKVSEDGKHKA
jgi:bacillithiol system protein YtxJ